MHRSMPNFLKQLIWQKIILKQDVFNSPFILSLECLCLSCVAHEHTNYMLASSPVCTIWSPTLWPKYCFFFYCFFLSLQTKVKFEKKKKKKLESVWTLPPFCHRCPLKINPRSRVKSTVPNVVVFFFAFFSQQFQLKSFINGSKKYISGMKSDNEELCAGARLQAVRTVINFI